MLRLPNAQACWHHLFPQADRLDLSRKQLGYTYDGLYNVVAATMEAGTHGFLECRCFAGRSFGLNMNRCKCRCNQRRDIYAVGLTETRLCPQIAGSDWLASLATSKQAAKWLSKRLQPAARRSVSSLSLARLTMWCVHVIPICSVATVGLLP